MSTATRTQRRYDHRLKELVRATGNNEIALESGVPRSTAYGWLKRSHAEVVSLDVHNADVHGLQREVIQLRRRNARLVAREEGRVRHTFKPYETLVYRW